MVDQYERAAVALLPRPLKRGAIAAAFRYSIGLNAVAGLLTQSYLSQVLLPTISSAQRTLSTFYDELFKVTKKAVKIR